MDNYFTIHHFNYGDILEREDGLFSNLLVVWFDNETNGFKGLVDLSDPTQTYFTGRNLSKYKRIGQLSLAAQRSLPYKIIPYPDITGDETMESVPVGTLYEISSYYWTYLKIAPDKHVLFDGRSSEGEVFELPERRKNMFGEDVTNGWGKTELTKVRPVGLIKGFV